MTSGVEESRIIALNFEEVESEHLLDYKILYSYIKERLSPNQMNYVFLDEIQIVPDFQKAVDSLYVKNNVDLYITGSNANLLSGGGLLHFFRADTLKFKCFPYPLLNIYNSWGG